MKITSIICIALSLLWVALAILQLWFSTMPIEIFIKLSITIGLVVITTIVIGLVKKEYIDDKKMKKDGYIDS